MTPSQQGMLFALFSKIAKHTDRGTDYMHGWVVGRYRVRGLHDLNNTQISEIIDLLVAKDHEYEKEKEKLTEYEKGIRMDFANV